MIDCRDLDEVVYHEVHVPRPDIQYSGSRKTENDKINRRGHRA